MEHFTKQQLILLAMLVAFVSSIVTGITTVSLMAQDPQGVTQTINRVVERTIERVATPEVNTTAAAATAPAPAPKEVTVVVREEEFVTKAVKEARDAIVRIKNKRDGALLGIGIIINFQGVIVADRNAVIAYKEYIGVYQGVEYELVVDKHDRKSEVITFKFKDTLPPYINPVATGDSSSLLAGQSVVAVSGGDRDTVSIGIISSLVRTNDEAKSVYAIDTTVPQGSLLSGTPLMNLDGKLIALKIGKDEKGNDIMMPTSRVLAAVSSLAHTQ